MYIVVLRSLTILPFKELNPLGSIRIKTFKFIEWPKIPQNLLACKIKFSLETLKIQIDY